MHGATQYLTMGHCNHGAPVCVMPSVQPRPRHAGPARRTAAANDSATAGAALGTISPQLVWLPAAGDLCVVCFASDDRSRLAPGWHRTMMGLPAEGVSAKGGAYAARLAIGDLERRRSGSHISAGHDIGALLFLRRATHAGQLRVGELGSHHPEMHRAHAGVCRALARLRGQHTVAVA